VFGHIKGNRSFRQFSLRGLEKVHTEFGIVALAHNCLKVAGIRHATLLQKQRRKKGWDENRYVFFPTLLLWGLIGQPLGQSLDGAAVSGRETSGRARARPRPTRRGCGSTPAKFDQCSENGACRRTPTL